jgi:hypothetical protein
MRFLFGVFVVFEDRQKTELKTIKTLEADMYHLGFAKAFSSN